MERYTPTILEFIKELHIFEDYYKKFEVNLDNNKIIKNNGNIIIANEKENNDQYNEAIKIIENRNKLHESDKEKHTKSRTITPLSRRRLSRKRYRTPSRSHSRKSYRSPSRSRSGSQTKKKVKFN
jgi:hypothetical protein